MDMKKKKPLRRHPELIPYSREHHKLLLTAQLLKTDVPDYKGMPNTPEGKRTYLYLFLDDYLEPHLQREEQELFPRVRQYTSALDEMIAALEKDHAYFRQQIASLKNFSGDNLIQTMDRLGRRLEKHVRKEEREFFQEVQRTMLND